MTEEPPQSWPRGASGGAGTRPLAADPITGELIESDAPPGGGSWVPAAPVAGGAPPAGHPAPAPDPQPVAADGWHPGPPVAGYPAAAYPPPYGTPTYGTHQYGAHPYEVQPYGVQPYGVQPYGVQPHAYPAPPYPAPPYPAPPYPSASYLGPARPMNGLAIASLVLGAVWLFWIGRVLALVFGYVSRSQIRRSGDGGDGLAIAGIVLGWVGVGFLALTILAGVLDAA